MRGKIKVSEKGITAYASEVAKSHTMCFDADSSEKWVRIYASKRWDTIKKVQLDDYDNKIPKKYDNIFINAFTNEILSYIEKCKENRKKKIAQEREEKEVRRKRGN